MRRAWRSSCRFERWDRDYRVIAPAKPKGSSWAWGLLAPGPIAGQPRLAFQVLRQDGHLEHERAGLVFVFIFVDDADELALQLDLGNNGDTISIALIILNWTAFSAQAPLVIVLLQVSIFLVKHHGSA
jgi:hypothetical protein